MAVALTKTYTKDDNRTKRLRFPVGDGNTYVITDNSDRRYEYRYDPSDGTSALLAFDDAGDRTVVFRSNRSGGSFTKQGKELLDNNNFSRITVDGESGLDEPNSSLQLNEETIRTLMNDAATKSLEREAKRIQSQQRNDVVVATSVTSERTSSDASQVNQGGPTASPTEQLGPQQSPEEPVQTNIAAHGQQYDPSRVTSIKENNFPLKLDELLQESLELARKFKLDDSVAENIRKQFSSSNKQLREMFKNKVLKYPFDAIYSGENAQDHMSIQQYEYRPPTKELVFGDPATLLSEGYQRRTAFTKEMFIGQIKLPMPNSLSDSNNVDWGGDAMNNLSAAITSGVNRDFVGTGTAALIGSIIGGVTGVQGAGSLAVLLRLLQQNTGVADAVNGNAESRALIGSAATGKILSAAGVNVSPESLLKRGIGVVPNSNMELMFNAPTLRKFEYSWKLAPRDPGEAAMINNIIRFFKQGMAVRTTADKAGGSSLLLGTPNIFRVKFQTSNESQIAGMHRLKTCAVTGCSVSYTPEGTWAAYDNGQPTANTLTLRLEELEPIYSSDYLNEFEQKNRPGSIPEYNVQGYQAVTTQEVGY